MPFHRDGALAGGTAYLFYGKLCLVKRHSGRIAVPSAVRPAVARHSDYMYFPETIPDTDLFLYLFLRRHAFVRMKLVEEYAIVPYREKNKRLLQDFDLFLEDTDNNRYYETNSEKGG